MCVRGDEVRSASKISKKIIERQCEEGTCAWKEEGKTGKYSVGEKCKAADILTERNKPGCSKLNSTQKSQVKSIQVPKQQISLLNFTFYSSFSVRSSYCNLRFMAGSEDSPGSSWCQTQICWALLTADNCLFCKLNQEPVEVKLLGTCLLWLSVLASQESLRCCWHLTGSLSFVSYQLNFSVWAKMSELYIWIWEAKLTLQILLTWNILNVWLTYVSKNLH